MKTRSVNSLLAGLIGIFAFANHAPAGRLQFALTPEGLRLSWPAGATTYLPEFADALDAGIWAPVTNTPVVQGDLQFVTVTLDAEARFFRLNTPPPSAPVIANLTAPGTAVRGTVIALSFDFADPDADIEVALLTLTNALATQTGEYGVTALGIHGETGHVTLNVDTGRLPFGPAQFSLQLRDAQSLASELASATVDIIGSHATGAAPVIVSFARVAASYNRPIGLHDRAPVRCALEVTDPDNDFATLRVRVTNPFGQQTVTEGAAASFALTGAGGMATPALLAFQSASPIGNYTVEVTPFDGNGHAGAPAAVTVSLVVNGGIAQPPYLAGFSVEAGVPGEELEIFGSGFSTNAGAQTLFELCEVPCEIVSLTPNLARVRLPTGTRSAALTARNPDGATAISAANFRVADHVNISPTAEEDPVTVAVGATVSFTATVGTSNANKSVTWLVNGIAGGSVEVGAISATGDYTAPAAIPTNPIVQVTAALAANGAVISPATPVTILPPPARPGSAYVLANLGGTVVSPDFRSRVQIPPGALASNTIVVARTLAPAELPAAGPGRRTLGAAEFGSAGLVFASPVSVTIPLTVMRPPGTALRCRFYNPTNGTFADEGITAMVNSNRSAAVAAITHFSIPVLDEAAPISPPGTAPTLTGISPTEIEECARQPLRLTGTGLTDDLRVELRNPDGTLAGGMRPETLLPAGDRAGFVLDTGVIPTFDAGTREYRVRLVRSHDDSLFAEIPFTVRGLPEFSPENGDELFDPPPMRVSSVTVSPGVVLHVRSGVLDIESLGEVSLSGMVDARGQAGGNGQHQTGGGGSPTGGAGGLGREDADNILGVHSPEPEDFGQHGNDPVGVVDLDYQPPARPTDLLTRGPRALGGVPGHNFEVGLFSGNPINLINTLSGGIDAIHGGLNGRRGLGAPASSALPRPGGGGGGGAGRVSATILSLADVDLYGGGGGGGGTGGAGVRIRTARSVSGPVAPVTTNPIVDARGGNGGNGSARSTLRLSLLFGAITLLENPDVGAPSGGGGGGGRSGTIEVAAAEGVFLDSETGRLAVGPGKGGLGGRTVIDADNSRTEMEYTDNPASDGENLAHARRVYTPIFPSLTFRAQVLDRSLLRLQSGPTIDGGPLSLTVQGELPAQTRTVPVKFNPVSRCYETTTLLFPGFNQVADPVVGFRDPLDAPRVLVLGEDTDGDGLTAGDETDLGTDPGVADTDEDGVNDGAEVLAGTNPLAPPAARPDLSFAPVLTNGSNSAIVNALAVQPDGRIVIGGHFTTVNSAARGGIARLEADGTLDTGFNPGGTDLDAPVFCVAVQRDGRILLGGQFNEVGGQPRTRLARVDTNGALESTVTFSPVIGAPSEYPGQVNCLAIQPDGRILIGGTFTVVNGQSRRGLARLHPDGSLDFTFNPGQGAQDTFGGGVSAIAVQSDGKILVGGQFATMDNQPRRSLARLEPDGSVESTNTFNLGAGVENGSSRGYVHCLAVQPDGRIVIGGYFDTVAGQPRQFIARANADGTVATYDTLGGGANGYVSSVVLQADGRMVFAGAFTSASGQPRRGIARLLPDGTLEPVGGFDPLGGADDIITALALQTNGWILAGGPFTSLAGQARTGLARLKNDPDHQSLAALNSSVVAWMRNGATVEVSDVIFELSTDGGTNWTLLGQGTRIPGGWQRAGLSLPTAGGLRACGRTVGGENNGSAGLVEQSVAFALPP